MPQMEVNFYLGRPVYYDRTRYRLYTNPLNNNARCYGDIISAQQPLSRICHNIFSEVNGVSIDLKEQKGGYLIQVKGSMDFPSFEQLAEIVSRHSTTKKEKIPSPEQVMIMIASQK